MRRYLIGMLILSLGLAPLTPVEARAPAAPAVDATVGSGNPNDCTPAALQIALNFVQGTGGGAIDFNCGAAPKTIVITGTLQITSTVSFDGGALGDITLSGGDDWPVFNVPTGGDLSLEDMVVVHGVIGDGSGGCIFSFQSDVFILRSLIHSCRAGPADLLGLEQPTVVEGSNSEGGAIYSNNGSLIIIDSQVLSSTAELGGGIRSLSFLQISGSRLAGNQASFGGAVQAYGTLLIGDSLIEHNASNHGGGLWTAVGSHATISTTTFYSNTATTDGGGLESRGTLTLTESYLLENVASLDGGGLNAYDGSANLNQVVVAGNRAGQLGGGLFANNPLVLADTQVLSNTSAFDGGGGSVAEVTITGGLFQNNWCTESGCSGGGLVASLLSAMGTHFIGNTSQGNGGGTYGSLAAVTGGLIQGNQCLEVLCAGGGLRATALALTDTQIIGNESQGNGGGAFATTTATLSGVLVQDNHCLSCNGGGVYSGGAFTALNSDFISNTSTFDGGGLYGGSAIMVSDGLFRANACTQSGCYGGGLHTFSGVTLTDTNFISNTANSRGGAVFSVQALISGGLFQGNSCVAGGCRGGALVSGGGALILTGTRFIQNTSAGTGGAVQVESSVPSRLVNALFARNSAATNGAALYADGTGGTTLLHVTVAGPASSGISALHGVAGTLSIYNTVIASYTVGISRTAGAVVEDFNLFFNVPITTSGGVTSGGSSFIGDPAFGGADHDNYHLRAVSDAIDAGSNQGIFRDVDGDPRPVNAGFDIGFDEYFLRRLFLPLILR